MIDFLYVVIDKISNYKLKLKLYKWLGYFANLLIRIDCNVVKSFCHQKGVSDFDNNPKIIASLTSFPARINHVHYTINTLLNQTVKPDRIILWLSQEQFTSIDELPYNLKKLQSRGLEIRLESDDLRSHKKYYYAFSEFKNDIVITFDDDLIYPTYTIENLINKHKEFPTSICCNRGHEIMLTDGEIAPYDEWKKEANHLTLPTHFLCPTGCGGVLYPPVSMPDETLNVQMFKNCAFLADDLWLKTMSIINGTQAVYTDSFPQWLFVVDGSQSETLASSNVAMHQNDMVIKSLSAYYPRMLEVLTGNDDAI